MHLTPSEFDLLVMFARHPGQILSRQQLMDNLYGGSASSMDRSVDSHVKNLRRKLDSASGKHFIETVYGVGYRFVDRGERMKHHNWQHIPVISGRTGSATVALYSGALGSFLAAFFFFLEPLASSSFLSSTCRTLKGHHGGLIPLCWHANGI